MRIAIGFGLALLAAAARADDLAALKAKNQDVVAHSPNAAGVFVVQDDATIKHAQSGLVCAAQYPNVDFWHAEVFDDGKGLDVGCDYGRNDKNGAMVSKFTIFAVKQKDGETLDQVFATYRGQVLQVYPDAVSNGAALDITDDKHALPDFRSEEFTHQERDFVQTDTLLVMIRKGWVVEIRGSFIGKPNEIVVPKDGGTDDAVKAAGDRLVLVRAFLEAASTLGQEGLSAPAPAR